MATDLDVPTHATYTFPDFDDFEEQARAVRGGVAIAIGDTKGRQLVLAINAAYGKFHEELEPQGYTEDGVDEWLSTRLGTVMWIKRALHEFFGGDSPSDQAAWAILTDWLKRNYDPYAKGVARLRGLTGIIARDTDDASTADAQARNSIRNHRAGDQHEFNIDADAHQFMGTRAHLPAVSQRYGNGRFGRT